MKTLVVFDESYTSRLKEHRVNPEFIGDALGERAKSANDWMVHAVVGLNFSDLDCTSGTPAVQECALVVANPLGLSVVFVSKMWGGTGSLIRAANVTVAGAGDLWDDRIGQERKQAALERLKKLHGEFWNGMKTLGAMAD